VTSRDIPSLLAIQVTLLAFGGAIAFFGLQQCASRYGHGVADRAFRRPSNLIPIVVLVVGPIDASFRWRTEDPKAVVAPEWYGPALVALCVIALAVMLCSLNRILRPRRAALLAARGLRPRALRRQDDWERW